MFGTILKIDVILKYGRALTIIKVEKNSEQGRLEEGKHEEYKNRYGYDSTDTFHRLI